MNFAVLAALKIANDRNRARARRRRREIEEERGKRNAPDNSSRSRYSSKEYSETEYLNKVVTEDPILAAFFKELEKKGEQIDEMDAEEIRKVIEEKLKLQAERVEKIQKKFEEIKSSGLDLEVDNYSYYQVTVGEKVLDSGNRAFGDKGEYARVQKSFKLKYKGIELASEWFKGDRKKQNPFEITYNNWYEANKDLENEIQATEEAIRVQERKIKYAIFHKEEKQEELERLKSKLNKLIKEYSHGEVLRKESDTFAEITPEQKDLLEEYFDMVEECRENGKDLDADIRRYSIIKENYISDSYRRKESERERNKWQRALDGLIEDGEASEELLDAIDTIISEENIGYKKYSEGKDEYAMQREGYSERFRNLVAWYLETRRENIVTKILHRKEEAYKALSVEHRKLCEMAGLVDEAQKIEDSLEDKKGDDGHGEHEDD